MEKYGIAVENAESLKKSDEYNMLPEDIEVEFVLNGREVLHSPESIDEMVHTLLRHGQQQAVVCRKVAGKKLKLVSGFRRWRSVKKINDEKLALPGQTFSEPLKIRVKVKEMNDEEAFELNLVENMYRDDLNPMDHAHNQRILRERFNWDDGKIADFYKQSRSYVSQLKKAMRLPSEIRQLVMEKKLAFMDANDLADIPEQEVREIIQEATAPNGVIDHEEVRTRVRNKKIDAGKGKGRTVKQLRSIFTSYAESNDVGEPSKFAKLMIKLIDGKIKDENFVRAIDEMFDKLIK